MASEPSNVREVGKRRSRTSISRIVMPMLSPVIERHRQNNDDSCDDLLHPVRQASLRRAELNDSHDGGANKRSEYRASAAEKTASTDDDCGNHVQLET